MAQLSIIYQNDNCRIDKLTSDIKIGQVFRGKTSIKQEEAQLYIKLARDSMDVLSLKNYYIFVTPRIYDYVPFEALLTLKPEQPE